jgi:hypothetical protein
MTMPAVAADAYDPTQEELNRDRNTAARYLPRAMQFGGVDQAYQMAQVPERAPAGGDGFARARSLQIPEGIPLPKPEGDQSEPDLAALEQAAQQDPELAEMLKQLIMARISEAGPIPQLWPASRRHSNSRPRCRPPSVTSHKHRADFPRPTCPKEQNMAEKLADAGGGVAQIDSDDGDDRQELEPLRDSRGRPDPFGDAFKAAEKEAGAQAEKKPVAKKAAPKAPDRKSSDSSD